LDALAPPRIYLLNNDSRWIADFMDGAHPLRLRSTSERYGLLAIVLHWTIALAILTLLATGTVMVGMTPGSSLQFDIYQLHKSLGITVLVLGMARMLWRLVDPAPALPGTLRRWEAALARVTHIGFYVLMIALPLSGWMMVSASVWNIPTVVFGLFTLPHLPVLGTLQDKKPVEDGLKEVHEALAIGIFVLLLLHVAGALRHHFVLRDDTLVRMLPGRSAGARAVTKEKEP
jgi:cytochrome b561